MNVLDLFSGIGGFSLGLHRAGMRTVAFCEIDPYCRAVLKKHWPDVPIYDDVRTLTGKRLSADGIVVDLICGGFPCQDISNAGKRAGIEGERSGLWSEYARIIGEVRPQYVIVENVAALLGRGLSRVLGDLAALGYDAEWHCIPACAVGAPHRRDRLWIVGFANGDGWLARQPATAPMGYGRSAFSANRDADAVADVHTARCKITERLPAAEAVRNGGAAVGMGDCAADMADTASERQSQPSGPSAPLRGRRPLELARVFGESRTDWLSEPDVGGTLDGFSPWLDRLDMTQSHQLLMAYGNAKKARPDEILRALRDEAGTPDDWRSAGGSVGISSQEILFAYLCKLEAASADEARLQLARSQASENGVRSVRPQQKPASASRRSGYQKQYTAEHPDTLQALSRLLAHHSQSAWAHYRRENAAAVLNGWRPGWEDGFPRVAHGVPARVDRLRALGNAVVPQIPEIIGRAIMNRPAA